MCFESKKNLCHMPVTFLLAANIRLDNILVKCN